MTTHRSQTLATIASGAALTGAVDLQGYDLAGIQMPAGWTAAVITLDSSEDGVTYSPVYDTAGNEVSFTVAASRFLQLTDAVGNHLGRYVKVRSGTNGSPVNQGADRIFKLVLRTEA